ncbi:MAG: glycoside hydrolase TIM-barrel-like domain-containing protein, partial [Hyphomonadaceae bacterium]|nr:glycoside hydrolase TIM-barrel-like domain-containing protein [Hyphomonadaceae bacterium]
MATMILSSAGNALFGPVGGFLGALAGQRLDGSLQGMLTPTVRAPSRLDRLSVQSVADGSPMARVWGRVVVGGHVIWTGAFQEHTGTSRPGGKAGPKVESRTYSLSFAIGLCEGPISGIGRVWANGALLDMATIAHRVHRGTSAQDPDPLVEAVIGLDGTPAWRDLAVLVFEDLPLAEFGDRIPVLQVEVFGVPRTHETGHLPLEQAARAVCLIPGSGEFALATTPVRQVRAPGLEQGENLHASAARTDLDIALDNLQRDLPGVTSVSLVIGWFGDDLRCGQCTIRPKVEAHGKMTAPLTWHAAGLSRDQASLVSTVAGRPAYGGSPSDNSIVEAIVALKARGLKVVVNPFILMDIPPGNSLPDPNGAPSQAAHPWRGRITCHPAPGQPGSPDRSTAAAAQVAAFFGTANASQFSVAGGTVQYNGPAEWRYKRFVLHLAALAKVAGGVDGFLLGSELVGLTRVADGAAASPAVAALVSLAAQVRAMLGPDVKIGYGADWTEYGAQVPAGASGDIWFPLDPLWADPAIDFIGIDWYAPIADTGPQDASPDFAGLVDGVTRGEGFDWYYASEAARTARTRAPITDGAFQEPWVYRQKDLKSWWSNPHHPRTGGTRSANPTAWVPKSKPVWLMELGFPAVDRAANRPSVFPDPKSSESGLPPFSTGA